ncbi:hypothetical protein DERF_007162 [Dermatophagoides farinae]|uniref:Uncharacterized protein n=1 Tax=Dermatophagoides farinae TaxID=6954 RepID=A0A922HYH4_DERFA|nr:hypothetical protein DERF_007162 [Dermatophagoides farinae]
MNEEILILYICIHLKDKQISYTAANCILYRGSNFEGTINDGFSMFKANVFVVVNVDNGDGGGGGGGGGSVVNIGTYELKKR